MFLGLSLWSVLVNLKYGLKWNVNSVIVDSILYVSVRSSLLTVFSRSIFLLLFCLSVQRCIKVAPTIVDCPLFSCLHLPSSFETVLFWLRYLPCKLTYHFRISLISSNVSWLQSASSDTRPARPVFSLGLAGFSFCHPCTFSAPVLKMYLLQIRHTWVLFSSPVWH